MKHRIIIALILLALALGYLGAAPLVGREIIPQGGYGYGYPE